MGENRNMFWEACIQAGRGASGIFALVTKLHLVKPIFRCVLWQALWVRAGVGGISPQWELRGQVRAEIEFRHEKMQSVIGMATYFLPTAPP